jgi:hypothetical protein
MGATKIRKSKFDIRPSSVLREVGANNHFKSRVGGPPMLRSPRAIQGVEVLSQL